MLESTSGSWYLGKELHLKSFFLLSCYGKAAFLCLLDSKLGVSYGCVQFDCILWSSDDQTLSPRPLRLFISCLIFVSVLSIYFLAHARHRSCKSQPLNSFRNEIRNAQMGREGEAPLMIWWIPCTGYSKKLRWILGVLLSHLFHSVPFHSFFRGYLPCCNRRQVLNSFESWQ